MPILRRRRRLAVAGFGAMKITKSTAQIGIRLVGVWILAETLPNLITALHPAIDSLLHPRPDEADWWFWLIQPTAITLIKIAISVYLIRCGGVILRLVRVSGGHLCVGCDYPLHGLAPGGQCPECGMKYDSGRAPST